MYSKCILLAQLYNLRYITRYTRFTENVLSAGQSTEGTEFAVALPRTSNPFDGLVRMTAREETSYTIESSTETRQGTIPAMGSVTEVYPMEQRVTYGVETVGLIVTADNPISVHLDQPSWELDAAMARPIDDDDTEFYIINYLNEKTTLSGNPLSFYTVVAWEDDTTVEVMNNERSKVEVTLDKFEVLTEDAREYDGGHEFDYTGVYVRSDKPVGVFAGHGRVQFPDSSNINYICDSLPNTAELGTSFTTFPLVFGPDDSGSVIRVLAYTDDTVVTVDSLGVSEVINAGEFYELEHRISYDARKVSSYSSCSMLIFDSRMLYHSGLCIKKVRVGEFLKKIAVSIMNQ